MPVDLRLLQNRVLWMEERDLLLHLTRIAALKGCYSGREVAKYNRKKMEEARNIMSSAAARPGPSGGKIAVIPVMGPIDLRMSSALMKADGSSCQTIAAMIDAVDADPRVSTVVFEHDSGGGSSSGIEELSDKIFDLRSRKRTIAIANSFSASASYWLASAAEQVVVTPSGEVGSIGAYVLTFDESEALAMQGVKPNLIRMPEFKAEFMPFFPMTDAARTHLQESVAEVYGKFVKAVARNRGTTVADVKANFGKGRMMSSDKALAVGAADKILSMDDLLMKLTSGQMDEPRLQKKRAEQPAGPSAEVLRERHRLLQRASKPGDN